MSAQTLIDRIDAVLPQTQCGRCGYAACAPYAQAIEQRAAPINRCPPGGQAAIIQLAALLAVEPLALDPAHGVEGPLRVAQIDETRCIGCTLCIQACPVDAIVGASKRMHTVAASLCSGCELCVAPCPVDCIAMVEPLPPRVWSPEDAHAARLRYRSRRERLARAAAAFDASANHAAGRSHEFDPTNSVNSANSASSADPVDASVASAAGLVAAALERARARRRAVSA